MKGKKLVFAVIRSLIVCLLLVPTCAFAEEGNTTDNPGITDNDQGGVTDPID